MLLLNATVGADEVGREGRIINKDREVFCHGLNQRFTVLNS
jgi:hypothetical protein